MNREDKLDLAGQYVLGLLDEADAKRFETTCAQDPELAGMAAQFAGQMSRLDETAAPMGYRADLWTRIEQQLITAPRTEAAPVLPLQARRKTAPPGGWWPLAASVLVALGAGYLAGTTVTRTATPTMIAVLLNEADASPAVIIEVFADDSVRLVPLESFAAPQGQVLQVWTLPDPATGPVSLGTLPAARDIRLAGPSLPPPEAGQLYEITLEPFPGSPTGRPTGPILVKGFAKPPLN
ncbi:MAG: hypothetical protein JWP99_1156 [Devosia sp.]|nr:hypothetical protein [Devosia sp.]